MKQRTFCGWVAASGRLLGPALPCAVLCYAVLSCGCENVAEKPSSEVTVSDPDQTMGGKIPDDWPKEIAIYPGAKILMTKSNPTQELLFLETADTQETALEFYKSKLAPMKPRATTNEKQQSQLSYQDDTGRRVTLSIGKKSAGGPKTLIAVLVNRSKEPASGAQ